MQPVLKHAERVWNNYGQELVITSALDGEHSAGSLHYYGKAVDLRSNYFDVADKMSVVADLRGILGCYCDVIVHSTHIHVEYDPK